MAWVFDGNVSAAMRISGPANGPVEFRAGLESSIHGFSSSIGPLLIFVSFFGVQSLAPAFWAALASAAVVPAFFLLLKGHAAMHMSPRTASLTAYATLILQLSLASADLSGQGLLPTQRQFLTGLAAGGVLFALASGLILLAGLFKLGNIFKMIPSTVTAGISNSTAVLLLLMAAKQIINNHWQSGLVALSMVVGFVLWSQAQKTSTRLRSIPDVLIALLVGLALHALTDSGTAGNSTHVRIDTSWIGIVMWPGLLDYPHLGHLLLVGLPGTLTLALIMILESFSANNVMESRFGLRIPANQELIALGGANMAGAFLGATPVTANSLRSVTSWMAGGRSPLSSLTSLLLTSAGLLLLEPWLLFLPAGIVAGLFFIQAPKMIDPAFKSRLYEIVRNRHSRSREGAADLGFWITFVITLAGIFGNLIWASFLGIGLSCLAVLRRVSGSLTSHWIYLDQVRSRRVRSLSEITLIEQMQQQVGILQLTGHLFFGNSARLTQLADEVHTDALAVVIDVSRVHDVDPSGVSALLWLIRALLNRKLKIVLTGNTQTTSAELQSLLVQQTGVTFSIDLDRGIEVCEDFVMQQSAVAPAKLQSLQAQHNLLLKDIHSDELSAVLLSLECRELAQGADLFHRLDAADGIWLLEEGMVSILSGEGDCTRLATFGPGQFIGEMGFIDGQSRSATARADTPLRAMFLNNLSLAFLTQHHPGAALKITLNIARELSLRMRNSSAHMRQPSQQEAPDSQQFSSLSQF